MKNILLIFMASLVFVACRQTNKDDSANRNIQLLNDSSTYSNNNIYSDSMAAASNEAAKDNVIPEQGNVTPAAKNSGKAQPAKVVYVKTAPSKKAQSSTSATSPVAQTPPVVSPAAKDTTSTVSVDKGNSIPDAGTAGEGQVKTEKKRGISKAAEGAIIGGAAGAVGGAIISKKKGTGAVIGGILGAAGGYILGKNKDKKDTTTSNRQ